MWTVVNLVERFCDRFDFFIVTRNCDGKLDSVPFENVSSDEWKDVGNANVFYASGSGLSQKKFTELINTISPDVIFLNSVFSRPAVTFLFARRARSIRSLPVVLAPCGELSGDALSIRPFKKRAFLNFAKALGLYRNVIWKASFETGRDEIARVMGKDAEIWIAPDLMPRELLPDHSVESKPEKVRGNARFVFYSRISRMKNLHFFLKRLSSIRSGELHLDIIGPIEDTGYWKECESVIANLPANISITVVGALSQHDALRWLQTSHFFVLPTLNENFGFVIIEAMAAGCPVLTSDRTVWDDIEQRNCGWRLPLEGSGQWIECINSCIEMENPVFQRMSAAARGYAIEWLASSTAADLNLKVFQRALGEMTERENHGGQ